MVSSLRALAERFLCTGGPRRRDALDLAAYRSRVRSALQHALRRPWADIPFAEITLAHLQEMRADLQVRGRKPGTISAAVIAIRVVWRWACDHKLIDCPWPGGGIPLSKGEKVDDWYSDEEIARIYAAARAHERPMAFPLLVVVLNSGMRAGEIAGLTWRRVHLDGLNARLDVTRSHHHAPKSGKPRYIPIVSPLVISTLRAWRAICPRTEEGLVFPARGRGAWRRARSRHFTRLVRQVLDAAGCRQPPKPVHLGRHTFATRWAAEDRPLPRLQMLLGHSSIVTTERYAHHSPSHLRPAMEGFEVAPAEVPVPAAAQPLLPARAHVEIADLPDLAELRDRLLYVATHCPWARFAASEARHYAQSRLKRSTVAKLARRGGLSARWLGFGERLPGSEEGLGERLRWALARHGWTQRDLVAVSGISEGLASLLIRQVIAVLRRAKSGE